MQKRGTSMRESKLVSVICPECGNKNKDIPANMGDQFVRCEDCKRMIAYRFRTGKIEIVDKLERYGSSGSRFY